MFADIYSVKYPYLDRFQATHLTSLNEELGKDECTVAQLLFTLSTTQMQLM